jgi:competence protein ComEC
MSGTAGSSRPDWAARPLPLLAASLLLGSLVGIAAGYLPLTIFCAAGLLLVLLHIMSRTGRCSPGFACLILGVFLAGAVSTVLVEARAAHLRIPDGVRVGRVDLIGEIAEPVRYGPEGAGLVVLLHRVFAPHPVPIEGRVRLRVRGSVPPLIVGDLIRFEAKLRPPRGLLNPGGFDYAQYLRFSGIHGLGAIIARDDDSGLVVLARVGRSLLARVDEWRRGIREASLRTLSPEAAGIYLALITGESGYLSQDIRDAFMASGTTHILSISGSHLGLISLVVFWVARRTILALPAAWLLRLAMRMTARRLAAILTIPAVAFYTLLGGAQVATVRSLIMVCVFIGAVLLGRKRHLATALAAAALLIVAWDPVALLDLSFQLSFLSVLAIVLLTQSRDTSEELPALAPPRWSDKIRKETLSLVLVGAAVTLITAPLVALHFHQLPWIGLMANLLVIPFVGFVIVPAGLLAALATLFSGSETLHGGALIGPAVDGLVWMVRGFAAIPGSRWMIASPPVWQVLLFYLCLTAAVLYRNRWAGRFAAVPAAVLLLLWVWSPRDLPAEGTRVTFLDVGQGDAAVVETADGAVMLIDGGGVSEGWDQGRAVVAPFLWDRGIRRVDVIVATHPQQDHIGGLGYIAREFKVGALWTNGIARDIPFVHRLEEILEQRRVTVRSVSAADQSYPLGTCAVRVLNPITPARPGLAKTSPLPVTPAISPSHPRVAEATLFPGPGLISPTRPVPADRLFARGTSPLPMASEKRKSDGKHLNNQSVVFRLGCGRAAFLFTGDIEHSAEAGLTDEPASIAATVLKVPHHGARGSLYEPFVRAVRPEVAVISVGSTNSYGHPARAVLDAYAGLGISVLRTDRDGAVTIVDRDSGISVSCEAGRRLKKIHPGKTGSWREETENFRRLWSSRGACAV